VRKAVVANLRTRSGEQDRPRMYLRKPCSRIHVHVGSFGSDVRGGAGHGICGKQDLVPLRRPCTWPFECKYLSPFRTSDRIFATLSSANCLDDNFARIRGQAADVERGSPFVGW